MPHYQRLATIRGAFPAFGTQAFIRVSSGNGYVYAFSRPFENQNAVVIANFAASDAAVSLSLTGSGDSPNVYFAGGAQEGKMYHMNDVYNDTGYAVNFSGGSLTFNTSLKPYGTGIYILSDSIVKMKYPSLADVERRKLSEIMPLNYALEQNYPNPFNPNTSIQFAIPVTGLTTLSVFDLLGREVAKIVREQMAPGIYTRDWNAGNLPSGIYFITLRSGSFVQTKRAMLLK
jgi:hypothetical protein